MSFFVEERPMGKDKLILQNYLASQFEQYYRTQVNKIQPTENQQENYVEIEETTPIDEKEIACEPETTCVYLVEDFKKEKPKPIKPYVTILDTIVIYIFPAYCLLSSKKRVRAFYWTWLIFSFFFHIITRKSRRNIGFLTTPTFLFLLEGIYKARPTYGIYLAVFWSSINYCITRVIGGLLNRRIKNE